MARALGLNSVKASVFRHRWCSGLSGAFFVAAGGSGTESGGKFLALLLVLAKKVCKNEPALRSLAAGNIAHTSHGSGVACFTRQSRKTGMYYGNAEKSPEAVSCEYHNLSKEIHYILSNHDGITQGIVHYLSENSKGTSEIGEHIFFIFEVKLILVNHP